MEVGSPRTIGRRSGHCEYNSGSVESAVQSWPKKGESWIVRTDRSQVLAEGIMSCQQMARLREYRLGKWTVASHFERGLSDVSDQCLAGEVWRLEHLSVSGTTRLRLQRGKDVMHARR